MVAETTRNVFVANRVMLNDAYLTGGSVFWGIQNAAVSQSTQLFANANGATTTTEITTDLANGRHEKEVGKYG